MIYTRVPMRRATCSVVDTSTSATNYRASAAGQAAEQSRAERPWSFRALLTLIRPVSCPRALLPAGAPAWYSAVSYLSEDWCSARGGGGFPLHCSEKAFENDISLKNILFCNDISRMKTIPTKTTTTVQKKKKCDKTVVI